MFTIKYISGWINQVYYGLVSLARFYLESEQVLVETHGRKELRIQNFVVNIYVPKYILFEQPSAAQAELQIHVVLRAQALALTVILPKHSLSLPSAIPTTRPRGCHAQSSKC